MTRRKRLSCPGFADGDKFACFIPDHNADAVGIRIGADDEVAADLLGKVDGQIKTLGILRVRAYHRREGAVHDHLLRDRGYVLDAQALEGFGDKLVARAVEGCVDDFELVGNLCLVSTTSAFFSTIPYRLLATR